MLPQVLLVSVVEGCYHLPFSFPSCISISFLHTYKDIFMDILNHTLPADELPRLGAYSNLAHGCEVRQGTSRGQ